MEGVDKKYLSIREKGQPLFQREFDKKEAGITLENVNTFQYTSKKQKKIEHNPYEH